HGSYVAPDWTADYLHREAEIVLDEWSRAEYRHPYTGIDTGAQAALRDRLQRSFRANTYDPSRRTLVIDEARAAAFARNTEYYRDLFARGRVEFAIPAGTLKDAEKAKQLTAFFFWSAWAAAATRPA